MSSFNGCSKSCGLAVLGAALLIPATANAGFDPADVRTTTRFEPPTLFGSAGSGIIFAGDPLIGLEVVETRVYWDVVVADGHDAAARIPRGEFRGRGGDLRVLSLRARPGL